LAVLLHPEIQKRAQGEIDRIVGRGRLPDPTLDKGKLVFVRKAIVEGLRWGVPAPLGKMPLPSLDVDMLIYSLN
jgi:hypothetical protein